MPHFRDSSIGALYQTVNMHSVVSSCYYCCLPVANAKTEYPLQLTRCILQLLMLAQRTHHIILETSIERHVALCLCS